MKIFIISVAFMVAAVQAGPMVKNDPKHGPLPNMGTTESKMKEKEMPMQHPMTPLEASATKNMRSKRDCGGADLDKIQEKITAALEKQIELLLGGHIHESGNKTCRATSEAAATSRVEPNGSIKTVAAARGNNDPSAVTPELTLTNGHQLPPASGDSGMRLLPAEGAGAPGGEELLPPPPSTNEPVQTVLHPDGGAPAPVTHPITGTGNVVQKVASKANKNNGTAVASAIAKRAAVLQTVDTSGGKAVANAESHKGADTNVQTVSANGTQVGIANALVDNKNASANHSHDGPEVVLQNVVASGVKAVATATNNKGSGSGVQEATADGEEISIASAVAARSKREVVLVSRGEELLSTLEEEEDDGSYKPENEDDRRKSELVLIRQRVARSPCISTKMDNNLRKLIEDTVATVFADLKKELKL